MTVRQQAFWRALLSTRQGDSAATRRLTRFASDKRTMRQHAVWRALLVTRRQDDSATTRLLACLASDKTTRGQCDNTPFGVLCLRQDDKMTVRQRAVWRALLATKRQDDSATTRRLTRFASDKTKRR
jgi:hypothetical protein